MARADLNGVRALLAVASAKSFQKAGTIVGVDHNTLSRRITALEQQAGVPLFHRRSTGAELTDAGRRLVEAGEHVSSALEDFDRVMASLKQTQSPVTVSAPEGIASYLLVPQTAGAATPLHRIPQGALPRLVVLPPEMRADIEITLLPRGGDVPRGSDYHARKLGLMRFKPVASRRYLEDNGMPETARDIARHPLLTHLVYEAHPSFSAYAALTHTAPGGPLLTLSTSSALHRAVLSNAGITLLPDFSGAIDEAVIVLPFDEQIAVEVWAVSHPDTLRLPSVRQAYDGICAAFHGSVWFRDN